jgi:hypothetical protein
MSRRAAVAAWVMCLVAGSVAADPIRSLRCNDASGAPAGNGHRVSVSGVVVGQFSTAGVARLFIQDGTGAVNVYGPPKNCAAVGDSIQVTGIVAGYHGLTEITGHGDSVLTIVALGHARHVPDPLPLTIDQVNATEESGGCEPNESRLIEVRKVWIRAANGAALPAGATFKDDSNYRLASGPDSSAAWVTLRVMDPEGCDLSQSLEGKAIPGGAVRVTGILSQYTPRGSSHGGYQVLPRGVEDIRAETVKP